MSGHVCRLHHHLLRVAVAYTAAGAVALLTACAHAATSGRTAVTPAQEWEQATCAPELPDTTGWTRYHLGRFSIAVPPAFRPRESASYGQALVFTRGDARLLVMLAYSTTGNIDRFYNENPRSVRCTAKFAGYPTEAVAWRSRSSGSSSTRASGLRGRTQTFGSAGPNVTYQAEFVWQDLYLPDQPSSIVAEIKALRMSNAVALRSALHTIRVEPDSSRSDAASLLREETPFGSKR